MGLYCPNARWGGEFEWPKTLQASQLENCRDWLSLGVRNLKKYISNIPYIITCCSGGFQGKFSSLIQKQTPAYSVVRHDWNFKWHWLLLSDETEKIAFWQQTHQMSLVQTGIKKYPMSTVKYTAGSLMLWACFSARGSEHLVLHGIMDSIIYIYI